MGGESPWKTRVHGTGGVCHSMKTSPKLTGPPLQAGVDGLAEGNQLG